MLIYLGTRLHNLNFEDSSNEVSGNKGQYSMAINIRDGYELSDPIESGDKQKSHHVLLSGDAELKGYAFNGDQPENLLDEEHLAFRAKAEFKVTFDVTLPISSNVESLLSSEQFHQLSVALSKVGVIEKLQQFLDSTSFRKVDVRRIPVECGLVPELCEAS